MSVGKINEFVDDKGFAQLDDLLKKLGITRQALVDATAEATRFNNAIAGSKSIPEFIENQGKAATAIDKVTKAQETARLAEIRIQQAREKAFDDFERKQAKAAQAETARLAKLQKERDDAVNKQIKQRQQQEQAEKKSADTAEKAAAKEIAADQKQLASEARIARQRDKDSAEYIKLIKLRDKALADARNIGATYGYDGKFFEAAAKKAALYQKEIDGINSKLGSLKETGGNVATRVFGVARTLANILPNFGIGTFFLVVGTGIAKIFSLLKGGESTVAIFNKLAVNTNEIFAEQATKVALLKQELDSGNVSQNRQREIIAQLNKISPTYFGNLKDVGDIVKKLPADFEKYNNALLLNSRIQAGLSLYTEKYKELLESQRKLGEVAEKPKDKGYLSTVLNDFQSIFTLGLKTNEIIKNVNREGASGVLTGSQKLYQGEIKNTQRVLNELSSGIISDQKKLQKNGGDIAGDQIAIAERIANSNAEVEKLRLQSIVDNNTDVANNDKKSYSERQSALKIATEVQQQILGIALNQELNDISLTNDKKAVLHAKYKQEIEKSNIDLNKKSQELRTRANRDEVEYENQRLERQKKTAESKTLDPSTNLDDRLDALTKYQKASKEIIKNTERLEITDAGQNAIKVKSAKEKAKNDLLDVDNDIAKKRLAIEKEVNAQLLEEFKEGVKNQLQIEKNSEDVFTQRQSQMLQDAQDSANAQLEALADQYLKGEIKAKAYADKKAQIEASLATQTIAINIDALERILALEREFGVDTASDEQKLADLKRKLSKETTDAKIADLEKLKSAQDRVKDLEKQGLDELLTFGATIGNAAYTNQLNRLQEQKEAIDAKSQAEINAVNNGIASEQDKAARVTIINAQALGQKQKIDAEEKRIKTKQAEFDKIMSIARITQATAIAEVEALTYLSNPLTAPLYPTIAALIGALGAIQIATVLATPIPKFEKGGTVQKDGPIITGEAGPELRIDPSGKYSLTAGHENVTYAKAGTKIINNKDLMSMVAKPEAIQYLVSSSTDNRKSEKLLAEIAEGIKKDKRPIVNVHGDRWGPYSQRRNY